MLEMALNYLSWGLLSIGGLLCITGAIGILRFPEFFTRMHAAGVTDTLALILIISGLLLHTESWLIAVKLIAILLFGLLTSPTASHALAKAAIHGGLKPHISASPEKPVA